MPKILEFTFKNVCSYGNKKQSIPFGEDPKLMLIVGENGAGKTTIGNAFEFSWYGKTRKRKLKEFANRYNGHLETYNKFLADDGRIVEIARGIEPAYFDLKVDGQPDNKAGKANIDEYIENELLGLPFEVCTNTMILSINDFKSFVKIKAEDKRKIVDRIFGMDILNQMNSLLKDEMKTAKEDLAKIEAVISHQNTVLAQAEGQLAELKSNLSEEAEKRKLEIEESISQMQANITDITKLVYEFDSQANSLMCEMNDALLEAQMMQVNVDNDELILVQQADTKSTNDIQAECSKLDLELSGVLNALDEQYAKTIDNLTADAKASSDAIKTMLAEKMSVIESKYSQTIAAALSSYENRKMEIDAQLSDNKNSLLREYRNRIVQIDTEVDKQLTLQNEINDEILKCKNEILATNFESEELRRKLGLYENNICPECESDLSSHHHVNRKNEFQNLLNDNVAKNNDKSNEIAQLEKRMMDCSRELSALSTMKTQANATYESNVNAAVEKSNADLIANNEQYNASKLAAMESKNSEIANVNSEFASKIEDANKKTELAKNMQHERDMKKQQTVAEYDSKKSKVKEAAWNILANVKSKIALEKQTKQKELSDKIAQINLQYNSKITDVKQKSATEKTNIQNITAQLNLLQFDLSEIQSKLADNTTVKSLEKMTEGIREQLLTMHSEQLGSANKVKLCLATQELLTEDGIKKTFMGLVLPAMNATIKRIIDEMQYKFNFHFDNDFNAIIEHMGHEVSANSLSTGEEKMIDLIVLLSVMELIKMKHPKINVMFLDEVFASLDQNNIEMLVKILRDFINVYKMTLFVISHTKMPQEYFDETMSISNDGIFSDIKIS